jgi:hypothetical protein
MRKGKEDREREREDARKRRSEEGESRAPKNKKEEKYESMKYCHYHLLICFSFLSILGDKVLFERYKRREDAAVQVVALNSSF